MSHPTPRELQTDLASDSADSGTETGNCIATGVVSVVSPPSDGTIAAAATYGADVVAPVPMAPPGARPAGPFPAPAASSQAPTESLYFDSDEIPFGGAPDVVPASVITQRIHAAPQIAPPVGSGVAAETVIDLVRETLASCFGDAVAMRTAAQAGQRYGANPDVPIDREQAQEVWNHSLKKVRDRAKRESLTIAFDEGCKPLFEV